MVKRSLHFKTGVVGGFAANKALVLTAPALCNFGIIARHKRFGGGVGAFLPHRARRHNAGVHTAKRRFRSASLREWRANADRVQ